MLTKMVSGKMDFGIDSLGPKLDSISVQIATKFGFTVTSSNSKLI
jgi:hypothetical protein